MQTSLKCNQIMMVMYFLRAAVEKVEPIAIHASESSTLRAENHRVLLVFEKMSGIHTGCYKT